MNATVEKIKIWDLPVRLFHWTLVLGFVTAYLLADNHLLNWHVLMGYFLCGLLAFRFVWGFIGNQYARFKSFIFTPAETVAYMKSLRAKAPIHYYGHNPAGALMVFALMAALAMIFLSGLLSLGTIDFEGPFSFLGNVVSDETSYFFRHLHDWLVNGTLLLIPLHLLGVIQGGLQHKENLVRAMVTGWKVTVTSAQKH
jgi:cytochrome b